MIESFEEHHQVILSFGKESFGLRTPVDHPDWHKSNHVNGLNSLLFQGFAKSIVQVATNAKNKKHCS